MLALLRSNLFLVKLGNSFLLIDASALKNIFHNSNIGIC
ncbi:hypothetical protein JCM19294_201 [Nonlabens tegetincola]|uniref:Uncharacterized protein n=1 Tax=Nonlabens tegetincola TaxID=323273 RepID=A0A090Q3U8_9FLAO|nr:hypothetical protein JCM19294_201 [Nonlabens tegetincola]